MRNKRAKGPRNFKGIDPVNFPVAVQQACSDGDAWNVATYVGLHTTLTLTGLHDIIEGKDAMDSWRDAIGANQTDG